MDSSQTFLSPVEKPKGLMMKLVYFLSKKQFGKVLTPIKIAGSRMPIAFGLYGNKGYQLDKKLTLPKELIYLIRNQVSRTNICEFCMDLGKYKALKDCMTEEKFNALYDYQASSLFSNAEKAALVYATELTRKRKVSPDTFNELAKYFTERQICEIVYLVASEHFSNITNIGLNIHSDMFCDINKKKVMSTSLAS